MKKTLSIMLTVLMCFSSIFGSIGYVAAADTIENAQVTYTFGEVEAEAGDTIDVPVTITSANPVNLTALAGIKFSNADAEVIGFTYSDDVTSKVNKGLSNYDEDTNSIVTLFNNAETFANGVVLGTLQVKIADSAADGEIEISAAATALDEFGAGKLTAAVVDGKIKIGEDAPVVSEAVFTIGNAEAEKGETITVDVWYKSESEANLGAVASLSLSNDDAQIVGFEFSDGAKAVINTDLSNYDPATKSIIALFGEAMAFDGLLGTLQIKIAHDASEGDITITATSRVKNENTDEIVPSKVVDGMISVEEKSGSGSDSPTEKTAEFIIGEAEAMQGETAFVDVAFATETEVNLIALASVTVGDDAQIVGFEFSNEAKAVINTALSNYDPATKSLIVLFNEAQVFDGVLGTFEIKVADDAAVGEIAITASAKAKNENSEDAIEASVVAGSIIVNAKPVEADPAKVTFANTDVKAGETATIEVSFKTTTPANLVGIGNITFSAEIGEIEGFEFSQAAKDAGLNIALSNYDPATNSVIALFTNATAFDGVLGTLKVKVAEDTAEGDYTVTATSVNVKDEANETVITAEVTSGTISVEAADVEEDDPIVSDKDYMVNLGKKSYNADKGTVVEIPVYLVNNNGTSSVTGGFQTEIILPAGFSFEVVEGAITSSSYGVTGQKITILSETNTEFANDVALITVKTTVPETDGTFEIVLGETLMYTTDYEEEITSIDLIGTSIVVGTGEAPIPPEPEMSGIEVTANAVEIADADKNDEDKIIEAVKAAITKIAVKWTLDKADTTVTTDDVTYSVDTAAKEVAVAYNNFTDVVSYTVAAPIPVVTGIAVDKDTIEVPYSKSEKIAEYIKAKINVQLVYDIKDNEDVASDKVKVTLGDGKVTVSVDGYNFTKDVTYTIDEPILTAIITENGPSTTTFEWNKVPTIDDAKAAYGKIFARYDFDNADGYKQEDVTAEAVFSVLEDDKAFKVVYAGYDITFAQFTILSAPKTLTSDKTEVDIPFGTADIVAFVKDAITLSVTREDGSAYEIKDGDIEITVNDEKTQATVKFLPKAIDDVVITITILDREVESIVALPETVVFAWDEEITAEAVAAKIESVVATYKDDADPKSEEVSGYTVTVDGNVATVAFGGAEDTIEISVSAVPATGIKANVTTIEVPYGTMTEDIASYIAENIEVYYVHADGYDGLAVEEFDVTVSGRADSATITAGDFETAIEVTYATQDAKLVAPEKISVPYSKHNEKTDAEIAEYIKEKISGKVIYVDIYGEEFDVDDTFTVVYNDEKATVSFNDAEAEIDVTLKSKTSSSSTPTGTVVRPGNTDKPVDPDPTPVDPDPTPVDPDPTPVDPDPTPVDPDPTPVDPDPVDPVYSDLDKNDWAYAAIESLTDKGIISGDATGTLRPDAGITREEVAKVILKAKGISVDESLTLNVTDPESVSDWATAYVATAIEAGIIKGYDDGSVKGNKVVTRAELAAIIVRAINATSDVASSSFVDVTDADWFFAEVECAKQLGIINGYEDDTFRGNNNVTRREAFAMVYRMVALIEALQQ